jgi:uncharacterized protein YaeQ
LAQKSIVYKAHVQVADIDHNYYADHPLTLARHPSETNERMMVRLAAMALQAHQLDAICQGDGTLAFGASLSDPDEPDVWLRDFTGQTRLWVEVGQPDEKALLKACNRADAVVAYCFSPAAEVWWQDIASKLSRASKLSVWRIPSADSQLLAGMADRSMQLQATVQEGVLMLSDGAQQIDIEPVRWKGH